MSRGRLSALALVRRWCLGMALVSWRYLWSTTPLHRVESRATATRRPPALPHDVPTDGIQGWESGCGPMVHRLFRVRVAEARYGAESLMRVLLTDFERLVPREIVRVHGPETDRELRPGDEFVVDMPGPWNGPVRVLEATPDRLRLATLEGHLEAGQIEFRAREEEHLVFEIEAWARACDWKVRALYTRLRLAKEIQLNMWVRVCRAAAKEAGGRLVDGVEIETTLTPA